MSAVLPRPALRGFARERVAETASRTCRAAAVGRGGAGGRVSETGAAAEPAGSVCSNRTLPGATPSTSQVSPISTIVALSFAPTATLDTTFSGRRGVHAGSRSGVRATRTRTRDR